VDGADVSDGLGSESGVVSRLDFSFIFGSSKGSASGSGKGVAGSE